MIRAVAFDFDGTLVESNRIKRSAYFEAVRELDPDGAAVEAVLAREPVGDRYAVMRLVAEELAARGSAIPGRSVAELGCTLADSYSRICERRIAECDEVPGATGALVALVDRGLSLFVNTGTPASAAAAILQKRGLGRFFTGVFGSEGTKVENLRSVAHRVGARFAEILVVGDSEDDRAAAEATGCPFVGIARDGQLDRFVRAPGTWLPDLTKLDSLLERSRGPAS